MTTTQLIDSLRRRGVVLSAEGEHVRYRAPRGVLGPPDFEAIDGRKAEILSIFKKESPRGPSTCSASGHPGKARPPIPGGESVENRAGSVAAASGEPRLRTGSQNSRNSQKSNADRTSRTRSPAPRPSNPGPKATGRVLDPASAPDPFRLEALLLPPAWDDRGLAVTSIGDREYAYFVWDGLVLAGATLGFDTETALIVEGEIPPLALASASSGAEHCLIHPDRLGEFLRKHRDRHLVFHNVAFDFWVVASHLVYRGDVKGLRIWWEIADAGRMHDTMLLDELIRLARTDAYPRPRDLAVVAREYAGVEIDKDDPYRLRYGEVIGRDWWEVERGFFEYAIKDPIATRLAYETMYPLSITLMEAHGYDPARLT